MRNFFFVLITPFLFLIGCTKDTSEALDPESEKPINEEPPASKDEETNTYFTYYANEITFESDNWIIIHDENGKLLDYKAFEHGETIKFQGANSTIDNVESLNITMSSHSLGSVNIHILNTYTKIEKGAVWSLGGLEENNVNASLPANPKSPQLNNTLSEKVSQYNITVNNIPGIKKYNIQSPSLGVVTADYNKKESTILSLSNVALDTNDTYILYIGDLENHQKYIFFNVDESITDLVFDYGEFEEFDYFLETNLPQNSYLFTGSRGYANPTALGRGYEMAIELEFENPALSRIGYINGFESYATTFQIILENYSYSYAYTGQIPSEITIRERPAFSISNSSLNNFIFETDQEYKWSESTWEFKDIPENITYSTTTWSILNEVNKSSIIGILPKELLDNYPSLQIDELSYSRTTFNITNPTYKDLITGRFIKREEIPFPRLIETIQIPSN